MSVHVQSYKANRHVLMITLEVCDIELEDCVCVQVYMCTRIRVCVCVCVCEFMPSLVVALLASTSVYWF